MPKPPEQLGPPKSGNSKCQILDSRAWAPELPNLLNSWDPQKLETPEASKQLCLFWVAVYKGSSFPLLLGGGSPQLMDDLNPKKPATLVFLPDYDFRVEFL